MSEPTIQTVARADTAEDPTTVPIEEAITDTVVEDVLVEEISIDGMCGVY